MKTITMEINEELFDNAYSILDSIGLDEQIAFSMLLKKIVKENGINFLISNTQTKTSDIKFNTTEPVNNNIKDNYNELKEENFDKLFQQPNDNLEVCYSGEYIRDVLGYMTKTIAKRKFANSGYNVFYTVTYASKNKFAENYWANPHFVVLKENWSFILNDWINRKLYLFNIPANSISHNELVARSDKPELIDIQIKYNDDYFTDSRSGYEFKNYLVHTLQY